MFIARNRPRCSSRSGATCDSQTVFRMRNGRDVRFHAAPTELDLFSVHTGYKQAAPTGAPPSAERAANAAATCQRQRRDMFIARDQLNRFQAPAGRHESIHGLEQIAVVVGHVVPIKEFAVLLLETFALVMLFLILNVANDIRQL